MSKRFGRNQKRKLFERLDMLEKLALGAASPATSEPCIDAVFGILDVTDYRKEAPQKLPSREVSLTGFITHHEELLALSTKGTPVAFQGGRFVIKSVSEPSHMERAHLVDGTPVILELQAIV